MIISHKHKFIFLKTNKTAGTSVEIALSKFCGREDVITPIKANDEKIRTDLGYPGPRNYLAPLSSYDFSDVLQVLRGGRRKRTFRTHMVASDVKTNIGDDIWNSYFKFCIERNPWDRMASLYFWATKKKAPRPSVTEFLASETPLILKRWGYDLYTIDKEIVVDQICRFENLEEDMDNVRLKIGLPEKLDLPHAKGTTRKKNQSYRDLFDDEQRVKIAELFAEEIASFGYEF